MILPLIILTINPFQISIDTIAKQDTLRYIEITCFDYWKESKKIADSLKCFEEEVVRVQIDDSTYSLQDWADGTFTTYKKIENQLFFKNKDNPNYTLFFDFKTLKGGNVYKCRGDDPKSPFYRTKYNIVCTKKIKIRGEYLYLLSYEFVGFSPPTGGIESSTEDLPYAFYNAQGEIVILFGSNWYPSICLRTDYFNEKLTEEEINIIRER